MRAELVVYPEGVHVCNNIPFLWRPLAADWLAAKLEVNRTGTDKDGIVDRLLTLDASRVNFFALYAGIAQW